MIADREADADGAVQERLNMGGGGGKLIRFVNFEVTASDLDAAVINLFEKTRRCPTGNRGVHAERVRMLGELVSDFIAEAETRNKFER